MSILMAILGSVLCVASFWLLIVNTSGACTGIISLVACVGIIVCSVVGAKGWYDLFGGKLPGKKN